MLNQLLGRNGSGVSRPQLWRILLLGVLTAGCATVLYARVYLEFERVRINVVTAERPVASTGGSLTVYLPNLSRLAGSSAVIIVRLANNAAVDKTVAIAVNDEELARVLLPAERAVRVDLSVANGSGSTLAAGTRFTVSGQEGGWSLRSLELANVHGFSSGFFSLVVASANARQYPSPSAAVTLFSFSILLSLSLVLLRISKRRLARLVQFGLAFLGLFVLCVTLVLPWLSEYQILLSTRAFWLCVALVYGPASVDRLAYRLRRLVRELPRLRRRLTNTAAYQRAVSLLGLEATHRSAPRRSLKDRFVIALFPALLGPCQVLLFGPYTLYAGNADEFTLSLGTLLTPLLAILLASATVLILVAFLCSDRWYAVYVGFLFGVGLALWLQGNFFLGSYGPLDGAGIDWSQHPIATGEQLALWIGLPLLLALFGNRILPLAPTASGVLVALQVGVVVVAVAQQPNEGAGRGRGWKELPPGMPEFSRVQNIVHIVLDAFQGDVFGEIVDDDEALRRGLEGFTFFADHAGAFPTTNMSVPAMLTGVAYRNEIPIDDFLAKHYTKRSLIVALAKHGYEVDFLSIMNRYFKGPITSQYTLPKPYVNYEDYRRASSAQLFDVSLFRHVPDILKRRIYNDEAWFLQRQDWLFRNFSSANRIHHSSNGLAFMRDFVQRMAVSGRPPVYKVLHVGMPHVPVVLDGECGFAGVLRSSREGFVNQSRCAVTALVELLDRLRELGIYDSSLILLTSDHGSGFESPDFVLDGDEPPGGLTREFTRMVGKAQALLVVKPPGARGALTISSAPSSITDIPATILDVMNLPPEIPGESAFRLDQGQSREREHAHYLWGGNPDWRHSYLPTLEVYSIRGPLLRSSSWSHVRTIPRPDSN